MLDWRWPLAIDRLRKRQPISRSLRKMRASTMSYLFLGVALLLLVQPCSSFVHNNISVRHHNLHTLRSTPDTNTNDDAVASTADPLVTTTTTDSSIDPVVSEEAMRLKEELLALADSTQRGFKASRSEKQQVKQIVNKLAKLNPTAEPAKSYYEDDADKGKTESSSSDLSGKWTLIYTDAPDITSLDSNNPLATSKLGRIGQECAPPYIKNVIEWKRPDLANSLPFQLPFSGSDDDRVLQKVVTEASAKPSDPLTVDLKIAGLELVGDRADGDDSADNANILSRIQAGPAGIIGSTPLELRGFLTAPFGRFKVKYLDEEFRIIETYQGFIACNLRQKAGEEWF